MLVLIKIIIINIGVSASLGGSFSAGFSVAASLAFSQEQSVAASTSVETKKAGVLSVTETQCLTYTAQLSHLNLHPSFLSDLVSAALSEEDDSMLKVVEKYGTHYFIEAEMGGKLLMTTSTAESYYSTQGEQSVSQSVQTSFSAKVSGYGANADAAADYSSATSDGSTNQNDFETASSHSTIISRGGAVGSFGPANGDGPSNWGEWAQTVDLEPVPINYKLGRIFNLIEGLQVKSGVDQIDVAEAWERAEDEYYSLRVNGMLRTAY